jgi:hypothetical protein
MKQSVELTESRKNIGKCISRQCQTYFRLAHYTDGLFKSYEEGLASSEWQAALKLRKHKVPPEPLKDHYFIYYRVIYNKPHKSS